MLLFNRHALFLHLFHQTHVRSTICKPQFSGCFNVSVILPPFIVGLIRIAEVMQCGQLCLKRLHVSIKFISTEEYKESTTFNSSQITSLHPNMQSFVR